MRQRTALMRLLVGCALIFGFTGPAMAVEYQWRVALEEIEGSMQHEYVKKFVEILEQKSSGKINCAIHFYGELGTSGDIMKLLQKGDLQFAFQSPGHLGAYIPEAQVFSIHYLFPTDFNHL
ncbi:MAG: hypothetical protein KFF68_05435, partial [Desulfosarcina sp.]|nr:hypothetical protein [Desulfosarcina sp.]